MLLTNANIIIIIVSFAIAIAAIYILYSIILFQGGNKGEELQLSTKNILEQVKVLFDKKEYALVELLASKYLDRVPGHTDVRIYFAKALYEDGKYNLAINQCMTILNKKSNDVETHHVLAKCYQKKGLLNKAIREYEIVFEQKKRDKDVVRTIAELYRETDQLYMSINYYTFLTELMDSDEEKADIQSILAELNIDAKDYPAAFEAYKARLSVFPKDIATNKKLAELYIKIGNYPVGIETLLYMSEFVTDPKILLWVYDTLVDLYEETEDYEKSVEFCEKLLGLPNSDKFKVRNRIALFYLKLDRINDGIVILEDLALMSQNGYEVTLELADAYIKSKEYQKSLDRYLILLDKALPKEAKQVNLLICELYIQWAIAKAEEGLFEESFIKLESAGQYNTINPEVYYNKALNHFKLKNYNAAVEQVNKALEYVKEDDDAKAKYLLLLSDAHHELGNFFEEKKSLTDLLKIDEDNAKGLLRLGVMFAAQSDVKNAEDAFKKAIESDPELIQAKYHLALLYENNNRERAKELYMEVLEQDPTYIEAKNALESLTSN